MKGFEVQFNNEEIIRAALPEGVVSVIISMLDGEDIHLYAGGLDSAKKYYVKWLGKNIGVGDKIHVKYTDVDEMSPIIETSPQCRKELKKRYYALKKELAEEGLI